MLDFSAPKYFIVTLFLIKFIDMSLKIKTIVYFSKNLLFFPLVYWNIVFQRPPSLLLSGVDPSSIDSMLTEARLFLPSKTFSMLSFLNKEGLSSPVLLGDTSFYSEFTLPIIMLK